MESIQFIKPSTSAQPVHRDGAGILFQFTDAAGTWSLLTQRARFLTHPGTWTPPGGSVDPGELPLEAAMRELEEELGVKSSTVKGEVVAVAETTDGQRTYYTYVVNVFEDTIEVPQKLPAETADVAWYLPEQVEHLSLHPNFRQVWNSIQ